MFLINLYSFVHLSFRYQPSLSVRTFTAPMLVSYCFTPLRPSTTHQHIHSTEGHERHIHLWQAHRVTRGLGIFLRIKASRRPSMLPRAPKATNTGCDSTSSPRVGVLRPQWPAMTGARLAALPTYLGIPLSGHRPTNTAVPSSRVLCSSEVAVTIRLGWKSSQVTGRLHWLRQPLLSCMHAWPLGSAWNAAGPRR